MLAATLYLSGEINSWTNRVWDPKLDAPYLAIERKLLVRRDKTNGDWPSLFRELDSAYRKKPNRENAFAALCLALDNHLEDTLASQWRTNLEFYITEVRSYYPSGPIPKRVVRHVILSQASVGFEVASPQFAVRAASEFDDLWIKWASAHILSAQDSNIYNKKAIAICEQALKKNTLSSRFHHCLANSYWQMGKRNKDLAMMKKGISHAEKAIGAVPANLRSLYLKSIERQKLEVKRMERSS